MNNLFKNMYDYKNLIMLFLLFTHTHITDRSAFMNEELME